MQILAPAFIGADPQKDADAAICRAKPTEKSFYKLTDEISFAARRRSVGVDRSRRSLTFSGPRRDQRS